MSNNTNLLKWNINENKMENYVGAAASGRRSHIIFTFKVHVSVHFRRLALFDIKPACFHLFWILSWIYRPYTPVGL